MDATSPRTDDRPMAFTTGEFWRGAVYAWFWFLIISTAAHTPVLFTMTPVVLWFTIPWSAGALLVGALPAYALGRGLQTNGSFKIHATAFTVFGAVIGMATTAVALFAPWSSLAGPNAAVYWIPVAIVCAASAIAVPLGWYQTARLALRSGRGEGQRSSPRDKDSAFECAV